MALCAHCGDIVSESDIGDVCVDYPTRDFPGDWEEWCSMCRRSEDRDDVYERAAVKRRMRMDEEERQ
jgi:hypothetical protein